MPRGCLSSLSGHAGTCAELNRACTFRLRASLFTPLVHANQRAILVLAGTTTCHRPTAIMVHRQPRRTSGAVTIVALLAIAAAGMVAAADAADAAKSKQDGSSPPCLCVFDIDRTLTGRQDAAKDCPDDEVVPHVKDCAYKGGTLLLSAAGKNISATFCASCYAGIVSAGNACLHGSPERAQLVRTLNVSGWNLPPNAQWSHPKKVDKGPLVTSWQDGHKQDAVRGIVAWYNASAGVAIKPADVYMFDDKKVNIAAFKGTGFNARQISCNSRDWSGFNLGHIGLCGATHKEVKKPETGVNLC